MGAGNFSTPVRITVDDMQPSTSESSPITEDSSGANTTDQQPASSAINHPLIYGLVPPVLLVLLASVLVPCLYIVW